MYVARFTDGARLKVADYERKDSGIEFKSAGGTVVAFAPYASIRYLHDEGAAIEHPGGSSGSGGGSDDDDSDNDSNNNNNDNNNNNNNDTDDPTGKPPEED